MRPPHPPDLEAEIRFLTPEEGGRKTPAYSGYRPQLYYDDHDWDAHQEYPDVECVHPGDTARTLLWFLSPDAHVKRAHVGKEFEVREGARVIGRGRITKILNLAESAERVRSKP
jgi:translation elongation factor EF-Tu-like GTPase